MVSHELYSGTTDAEWRSTVIYQRKTGTVLCKADMQFTEAEMIHLLRWHFDRDKQWHSRHVYFRQVIKVKKFENLLLFQFGYVKNILCDLNT